MAQMKDGCVKPARGPIAPSSGPEEQRAAERTGEVTMMRAQVGKEAPDFEANAYVAGVGFEPVRLSSYKGMWIVLCFYPGDFTFV
jgi:peroxiredoxin (alkyl hydroperoxide reductase subunit C)